MASPTEKIERQRLICQIEALWLRFELSEKAENRYQSDAILASI